MIVGRLKANAFEVYQGHPQFKGSFIDDEVASFITYLQGRVVCLKDTNGDLFEVNDGSIWLPKELFEYISEDY